MIAGEDETSSVLNGRLRPRKSTAIIPNPPNKSTHKPENKVAQDKPKRINTPSKASPNKQNDLTDKADTSTPAQLLCPYCDRKFITKLSVSIHARRIHLSSSKQDSINCLFCNHSENVFSHIIRHMVDCHPDQYFACLDCNTRFLSTSELAEHKLKVCEKQKQAYRSKLRRKTSSISKKVQKRANTENENYSGEPKELKIEPEFKSVVISCELKPSNVHDAVDIEDNITTNLIMPSNIGNTILEKNAMIILDDIQWNRRVPPNFSFRNADADQILSRLGVVHRSPRVGESTRREWLKMIDVTSQKFEKCFDTNFYSRVASNVQQNLAKFLDGSFNFSPDPDKVIKTRKSKISTIINTAEGFPILLPHEQYSRNRFDGYLPRAIAPKHKWKWDSAEIDKNIIIDASAIKRDNHVDNCIITLVSSLDIWTQLRMRRKFEELFCKAATEKIEKQNIISRELKEILESREIPCSSTQAVDNTCSTAAVTAGVKNTPDFPSFLGLSARASRGESSIQPAVLSGEWVRPRCYVCCACGDQTLDSRALTAHMAANHPNAQVQHYEIVGESLLNADILKHLYVPPSQMSNRTRPLRGVRDCTKCTKSITIEDLHQHMLDCAGDTPTVRRKCRSRPFGVRRRRPRLTDNTIQKKMRKDLSIRHNQKALMRARPKIRTEVGDAETIRKMIADLPAKRHRQASSGNRVQVLRPRRKLDKQRNNLKIKRLTSKNTKTRKEETKNDVNDSSLIDEDDQPLKPKTKIAPEKIVPAKKRVSSRVVVSKHNRSTVGPAVSDQDLQDTPTEADGPYDSQPLQTSSENISRTCTVSNINTQFDDNGNKSSDEERDTDNNNSVMPDPALLKHSINNITASSSKALQSQYILPQESNDEEIAQDTRNIFLENEVKSSLPVIPSVTTNQKRSSQKKRESLLNCIEKIKNQKGETMYDRRQNHRGIEHLQIPLSDPHPAVIISRSIDESGDVKNVVPGRIGEPQLHGTNLLNQSEKNHIFYPHFSDFMRLSKERELFLLAERNESNNETTSLTCSRPPFSITTLPEDPKTPSHLAKSIYQQLHSKPKRRCRKQITQRYNLTTHACLQEIEQPERLPYPPLLQHQAIGAFQNYHQAQYANLSGHNASELHYGGSDIPLRNETVPLIGYKQNPNMLSPSPPSWKRDPILIQHMNSNNAPVILPSLISTTQRTSHKRVSESSETDAIRRLDQEALLNHAYVRAVSSETTANMYSPPTSQGNKKFPQYYHSLSGTRGHYEYDINTTMRNYGNSNISESMNKSAERCLPLTWTTGVNNHFYAPRYEEHPNEIIENNNYNSQLENPDNVIAKNLHYSNVNNHKLDERYNDQPHLLTSVPSENRTEITSPNYSTIRKSVDTYSHDQAGNSHRVIDRQYDEMRHQQETFQNQTDSSSTEKPLNLSVKRAPVICNDSVTIVTNFSTENLNQTSYEKYLNRLCDLPKTPSKESKKNRLHSIFEDREKIAGIDSFENDNSDLSFKDKSQIKGCIGHHMNGEEPTQPRSNMSTETYYKDSREMETTPHHYLDKNNYSFATPTKNTNTRQYSYEEKIGNDNYYMDPVCDNLNDVEKPKLHSKASGLSVSETANDYLTNNISFDQSEQINENKPLELTLPPPLENQRLLEPIEETAANSMQTNNLLCRANCNNAENSARVSPNNIEQNTVHHGVYTDESNIHKVLHSGPLTNVHNQILECNNEEECVDNASEKYNNTNLKDCTIDQDTETAKKIALFPKELVDLLDEVPKEQHNRFVKVISQLLPPAHPEGTTPIITVEKPASVTQNSEDSLVKLSTSPIDETITNNANKLTINTTFLPASSIIPKKRHSPSARLALLDACSNLTFSKPSPETKQQPTAFKMNTVADNNQQIKSVPIGYEYATNPIKSTLKIINEKEPAFIDDNIIDLTDEDTNIKPNLNDPSLNVLKIQELVHEHHNSNTPKLNANVLNIQESAHKLQVPSKSSNEKTASLRAVRIKTPLVRKSITDEKQPIITKEIYRPQFCLDAQNNDSKTIQQSNSECVYKIPTIEGTTVQNLEYPTQIIIQTKDETSKLVLLNDCEKINELYTVAEKLEEIGLKERSLRKPQEIIDIQSDPTTPDCLVLLSSVDNQLKTNIALDNASDSDIIEYVEVTAPKSTEHFESKNSILDLARSNCQKQFLKVSNPLAISSQGGDQVIRPDQNQNNVENNTADYTQIIEIGLQLKDNQQPEYEIVQLSSPQNLKRKKIFYGSDDSDDDDISLAVIVKQKKQRHNRSSGNIASTSYMNNMPELPKNRKIFKSRSTKTSKSLSDLTDSQLFPINSTLRYTVSLEELMTAEFQIEKINTYTEKEVNKESHKYYEFESKNDTKDVDNKDEGTKVILENSLSNVDLTPISNAPDEEHKNDDIVSSQINTNDLVGEGSLQNLSYQYPSKDTNCSNQTLKRSIEFKHMQSGKEIETTVQDNDNIAEDSELQSNRNQEASSTNYLKTKEANVLFIEDKTMNIIKIKNTSTELLDADTVNGVTQLEKNNENPEVLSDFSIEIYKDEPILRRSKRGKSIFIDAKNVNDRDTMNTVLTDQDSSQKIPVTKKQLIFSKLLLDEKIHGKNNNDVKETRLPIKRKISPGITKNEKINLSDSEYDNTLSNLDDSISTSDINNENANKNELSSFKTFIERNSLDSRDIRNEIHDISGSQFHIEGLNINISLKNNTNDCTKEKLRKSYIKNRQQDNTEDKNTFNTDTGINKIGNNTKLSESSEVKIDYQVAGTSGYNNIKKYQDKAGIEIRTACYNRHIASNQMFSTSVPIKDSKHYDPYDIDLDMDMAETTQPIVKTKINKFTFNNSKSLKSSGDENSVDQIKQNTELENHEILVPDTFIFSLSDSDSSISDAPLQKYVDKKKKLWIDAALKAARRNHKYSFKPYPPRDRYMENFGFFSIKLHRQSNLLASKKIYETFNVYYKNDDDSDDHYDGDDEYFQSKRQRKSSNNENRKTTSRRTSKVSQDTIDGYYHVKKSTTQTTALQRAESCSAAEEQYPANDDGEVDLITAQKMLESEEIRKLENDLYSGFKEAAEANAGRTSGFNQLRAEDTNTRENYTQDVFTPIESHIVETENREKPEKIDVDRPESPDRSVNAGSSENSESSESSECSESSESFECFEGSESSESSDCSESLKEKPLMYPEEQVNIYENKFDLIKRRRYMDICLMKLKTKYKHGKIEKSKKIKTGKSYMSKKSFYLGSQVLTKGALKGFDGIKISIPTQDLNLPPNVSPPHRRQRQSRSNKRKEFIVKARNISKSANDTTDVYEFQDDDKPVTKSYKLKREYGSIRSSSSEGNLKQIRKNRAKYIEKDNVTDDREIEKSDLKKRKGKDVGNSKAKYKTKNKGKGKDKNKKKNKSKSKSKSKEKSRDKKKRKCNDTNKKTVLQHKEDKNKKNEKCKEENIVKLNIDKLVKKSEPKKKADCQVRGTIVEDELSNDFNNTSVNPEDNEVHFIDSDTEDQTAMPGLSGFVPDRNDESSYESDSSCSTFPSLSVMKGPYACTCLSEVDSDDSEKGGCEHGSCRYNHLNPAKNAVMGKIFRNAVRCDKSDDTPDKQPKPKRDLDRLFDSLLEQNADNKTLDNNISPSPGPSSATYDFTSYGNNPHETLQSNHSFYEQDVSYIDHGFSSPNHRDPDEKATKNDFECASQTSPNNTDSLKIDDDSVNNFGEPTNVFIDNVYIMVSQKNIQTEDPAQIAAGENSDEPIEEEVSQKFKKSKKNNNIIVEDSFDNLPESSDYIKLKCKRDAVKKTRGTQTKLITPASDESSCEDQLMAPRKNKRMNKKYKSHHRRNKEDGESVNRHDSRKSSVTHNGKKNEMESKEKQLSNEKLSPSRKSDEGISTSHDNSADAYDMAPAEATGVVVERARRKCTVGKQNVLVEDWSSSESDMETAPNRVKSKKNSGRKRRSRSAKKDRANRPSHDADSDVSERSRSRSRSLIKPRTRVSSPSDHNASKRSYCTTRGKNDVNVEEMHGWIVGDSHKRVLAMLVCSKSKSRNDAVITDDTEIVKE